MNETFQKHYFVKYFYGYVQLHFFMQDIFLQGALDDHYTVSVNTKIITYLPVAKLNVNYNTNLRVKPFSRL